MRRRVAEGQARVEALAGSLNALSPLATLARGYSICRRPGRDGGIVRAAEDVATGDAIHVTLGRGSLAAEVTARTEGDGDGQVHEVR